MEHNYFELLNFSYNIGAFLHARMLAVVPGSYSIVYMAGYTLTTVDCVSYDPSDTKRSRLTFSKSVSFKNGKYNVFLSHEIEEIPTE